ncbi:hypothetical protein CI109_105068 [Kwoniella shandongensis]|uniref:Uncharacterized protein n=1 Tax=Kwoniella shandongensis TaxID=1734106 RepID=A0A5M6BZN0_9TREE|nr:uncharacterized protein CI109_004332 [Kwoniella shandongensis]KAA5527272.1 hypothetical protein CI109_004332 [Kwoniella shandongensis]
MGILPSIGLGAGWGGMPGCAGFVSGVVPWCQQQQQQQVVPQLMAPAVQVQQILQPRYGYTPSPIPPVVQPQGCGPQMGGQGGFASPGGGGGWSWYMNGNAGVGGGGGGMPVVRQPAYYTQPQQRTVQYQRPGLQIQVQNNRGYLPASYPYSYRPHRYTYAWPYAYTANSYCSPFQPWYCKPFRTVFAYAHEVADAGVNIQSQSQGVGMSMPMTPPSVGQPVIPVARQPVAPIFAGLANLENAFYPLLVGAIALLVVFDYAS